MQRRQLLGGLLATVSLSAVAAPTRATSPLGKAGNPLRFAGGHIGDLPPIDRDQGMGATDASGFVSHFPLRATGARQIWVNTQAGSPSYNGLSPYPGYRMNGTGPDSQHGATGRGAASTGYGPKHNFAAALDAVTPSPHGEGNQFFFAEGQTFVIDVFKHSMLFYHGTGVDYPACFQSYDPRDPLAIGKHGRAGTGGQGARPIWQLGTGVWPTNYRGDAVDYGNWVFRGLEWRSVGNGQASAWAYSQNNMLFEGMVFNNVMLGLSDNNSRPDYGINQNNIVRMCASYGQYDTGGAHICGIYSEKTNLTIEDCVFWHCGWKIGASRDLPVTSGGPDIFKHCLYLHNGMGTTSLVRRTVMIDGSASGLSLRGNHLCHHNVIIDCPTPDSNSGGSGSDTESLNGVSQRAYCQLVIGGADISSKLPRMQGFGSSNGTVDSFYARNLYANNPGYGHINNTWRQLLNHVANQISHMAFYHNRAYAFAPPNRTLQLGASPSGSVASIHIAADVDNLALPTSPMTNDQLYGAIGYPGKSALIAAMVDDPTQNWAYKLLAAAAVGFAFSFNYVMA